MRAMVTDPMRHRHIVSAAIVVSLTAHSASAQTSHLAREQVIAAVAEGTKSKQVRMATGGSDTANQFTIAIRGPYGRVVSFAADKALKYQVITAHEVPHDLTGLYLDVIATPGKPTADASAVTPPATQITLRRKGDKSSLEPMKVEPFQIEWDNKGGAKLQSRGLRALFDLSKVPQNGDLDVVVVTKEFERVYTFKEDERARMK
jgi:hypothetical protein